MKRIAIPVLAVLTALCLVVPAAAQKKMAKCSNIQASVDVKTGGGAWENDHLKLGLLSTGGGWVIMEGENKGENCPATKGQKLRFNFNDGAGHMVNVKASSKAGKVKVREGSRPAIVLVDVTGSDGRASIHFEITGSPNPKAKVGGCPGGNFYLEIE